MPPKLPVVSGAETMRVLEQLGFVVVRQRGSHVILKKKLSEGEIGCVVPMHKVLAAGTLRSVLPQANVSVEDFVKRL